MKILVPVKRVVDYNVRVRLNSAGDAVQTDTVRKSLNPFDETAVEEAVRLKERGAAQDVVAVSVGSPDAGETVRTALAVGADRGILIDCGAAVLEPSAVAKILKIVCERERPDLVLCGRQAIDDDAAQMGPMLAMRLGWAQGIGASKIDVADGAGDLEVRCEMGRGTRTVRLGLPAVVAVDLRLNEPRYVTLPGIMRAKKKPLEILPIADFAVDLAPQTEHIALRETPPRRAGVLVGSAAEFLDRLFAKENAS